MRFEKCWFYCIPRPRYSIRPERCKDAAELHLFLLDDPASLEDDVERLMFCRSKCHKNFKMKRNPRKVKWTKAYRRLHGKDMTEDSTFEFERRRNRPKRYDRNLAESTLMAIKKIDKVRTSREARHHTKRMKPKKAKEQTEGKRELDQSIHLIKAALQSDPSLILPKIKVNVYQQQSENRLMEE